MSCSLEVVVAANNIYGVLLGLGFYWVKYKKYLFLLLSIEWNPLNYYNYYFALLIRKLSLSLLTCL